MNHTFSVLIIVGGGLGTFLLGMKHLSEGLQVVGRSGLQRFMALATTHRLADLGTGIISTMIVQPRETASAPFGRAGVHFGRNGDHPESDTPPQERRAGLLRTITTGAP